MRPNTILILIITSLLLLPACAQEGAPAPAPTLWSLSLISDEPLQALEMTLTHPAGLRLLHVGSEHPQALVLGNVSDEVLRVALVAPAAIDGVVAVAELELQTTAGGALQILTLDAYAQDGRQLPSGALHWRLEEGAWLTPGWRYQLAEIVERLSRPFRSDLRAP